MPLSKVNLGAAPDDGRGDTLRDAFAKVNAGFEELAAAITARLTAGGAFAPRRHEHVSYVTRQIGHGPPDAPPALFGAIWIDAAGGDIYIAAGAEQVSDWRKVAFAEPVA